MYGVKLVGVVGMIVLILGLIGSITDWANDVPWWFTVATRVAVLGGAVGAFVSLAVLYHGRDGAVKRTEEAGS